MLNIKRFLATAAMVATLVSATLAASPVGSWVGKIVLDKAPAIPKDATPEQKKMMTSMIEMMKKMQFTLKVNKDKTFTITTPPMMGQPANKGEGTWTQKGSTVTIKMTKDNGKPVTGPKANSRDLTLSADGKKLTLSSKGQGQGQGKLVFTRK